MTSLRYSWLMLWREGSRVAKGRALNWASPRAIQIPILGETDVAAFQPSNT